MAPIRPEFFYHPVVGVVSPASLNLLAFKSSVHQNKASGAAPPKPLTRVTPPETSSIPLTEDVMMASTSPAAIQPVIEELQSESENEMKKPSRRSERMETCIVTQQDLPHTQMIRFVIDPQGMAFPDLNEKLPGNGYWITAKRDVIKKAVWRNSFTTAARTPVNLPDNLLELIEIGLLKQSLETIGLARKAGLVTAGFAKVEEALRKSPDMLYVVASDGRENGREKLERLTNTSVLDIWTSSQLSAALGEDNAVHIVFSPGGLTEKLLIIAQKLKDIR